VRNSQQIADGGVWEFVLWLLRRRWRFRVTENSMLPLLWPGEELLINPYAYRHQQPAVGDVVLSRHPTKPDFLMVKRITALLDNDRYFLQGDNLAESSDSRSFGPVSRGHLVGQVTSRF